MKKTQIISAVTSLLLAQALMMSGCGGGGSSDGTPSSSDAAATTPSSGGSSSSTSDAGTSSSVAGGDTVPYTVYVATLYPVVDATVVSEDKEALIVGNGTYEFSRTLSGAFGIVAKDGVVDLNGNDQPDHGEPYAPEFSASGESDILNPFTTLLANGMSSEEIVGLYPSLAPYAPAFAMTEFPIETAKDTLKATIRLAIEQYDTDNELDQLAIEAEIDAAGSYAKLNLIYQIAMYKIDKLYTDESLCLPLAPCYYPGITPELDVDYDYTGTTPSAPESSSSSSEASSASSSSSSSSTSSEGGAVAPTKPV